ncbi:hypothetical protein SCLCIDRAFT_140983 [Scleroderma citrinum Foug A]|uniref:DUF6830 domain-containing protein n=1 Tax=Scleroderma citrinum Foug A TaxID=1036808 RepID=A0A0C3D7Z8_9AGAM|nr:hypothetical protein SCLCIDRAFT_140983 [Scleroderma citrinum Foug A]
MQTVIAAPPSTTWPHGQYDAVLVNVDSSKEWPKSGLEGHCITELQLIFCLVPPHGQRPHWNNRFLAYIQRFDIVPQSGGEYDPITCMHVLHRAKRANGKYFGDILPLNQLQAPVNLVLHFRKTANKHLSSMNSTALLQEFWLNKYWEKEFFYALTSVSTHT